MKIRFMIEFSPGEDSCYDLENWPFPSPPQVGRKVKFADVESGEEACYCTVMDVMHCLPEGVVEVTIGQIDAEDPKYDFDDVFHERAFFEKRFFATKRAMETAAGPTRRR